ncbi:MAG: hypothetical protein JXP73_13340 [Deltaproteobacteria bacterium]|jgi:hypothetical protein|nr:hypothetical protein [Deltaproteobacteria bacterium]
MSPRRCLLAVPAVVALGCFQDSTPQHSDFVPLDYQTTFQAVRTCRSVPAHGLVYLKVLANAVAAAPYTAGVSPLPSGSVLVGEHHADPSCNSLIDIYLMAKADPGYDVEAGDWRWQRLDANQRVLEDGHLQKCSSCHAQPPCTGFLCSPP